MKRVTLGQSATREITVSRATIAVYTTFFVVGFVFASWASRLVAVRDALAFTPAEMGRLLLVGAIGSIVALPVSGWVVQRIGGRRTIVGFSILMCLGYGGTAATVGSVPLVVTAILLLVGGVGMGVMDSAMNLEGARVETVIGRSIMPRFHGFFSLGTMGGALVGAGLARLGVSLPWHVGTAILAGFVVVQFAARSVLPAGYGITEIPVAGDVPQHSDQPATQDPAPSVWQAWGERHTWLIGVVILAAALTEGAGNDWIALGVSDGFDVSESWGAFALFVFLTFMTIIRFLGTSVVDTFGRVAVLRACGISAIVGLMVYALAPTLWLAVIGAAMWGAGASLGFPLGMSAASDDPVRAPARVAVVATIGYTAFFIGPPLLGELADHFGYRLAMLVIVVPAVLSVLVAGVARRREAGTSTVGHAASTR